MVHFRWFHLTLFSSLLTQMSLNASTGKLPLLIALYQCLDLLFFFSCIGAHCSRLYSLVSQGPPTKSGFLVSCLPKLAAVCDSMVPPLLYGLASNPLALFQLNQVAPRVDACNCSTGHIRPDAISSSTYSRPSLSRGIFFPSTSLDLPLSLSPVF